MNNSGVKLCMAFHLRPWITKLSVGFRLAIALRYAKPSAGVYTSANVSICFQSIGVEWRERHHYADTTRYTKLSGADQDLGMGGGGGSVWVANCKDLITFVLLLPFLTGVELDILVRLTSLYQKEIRATSRVHFM